MPVAGSVIVLVFRPLELQRGVINPELIFEAQLNRLLNFLKIAPPVRCKNDMGIERRLMFAHLQFR